VALHAYLGRRKW